MKPLIIAIGLVLLGVAAVNAKPSPKPEWHALTKDTVACFLGGAEVCQEIQAGQVLLLAPADLNGTTIMPPLSLRYAATPSGWWLPSNAFDPKPLHCQAKQVLLHEEVTCDN